MANFRYTQKLTKIFLNGTNIGIRGVATLKHKDIKVTLTQNPKSKPDPNNLVFGKYFSDHMLTINWTSENGWEKPRIIPFENLSLAPATSCLHYATELFESMKAYHGADNKIRMFRPMENMKRMNDSAIASSLPTFDGAEFLECIKDLIRIDRDWIPHVKDSSLYIRPVMIATEPYIGVRRSDRALLYCIIGPVGAYYKSGTFNPVKLYADPDFVRSCKGGVGDAKMGANYASTIRIQDIAETKGCEQVLWLYGEDHQITEVGTMNIFVHWINENGDPEIATPPLNGLILPGVTRKSLLELGRNWGTHIVSEREITFSQIKTAVAEGRMKEMFGSGTACVISPVSDILYLEEEIHIPTVESGGEVSKRFYKELTDIQYGYVDHEWSVIID